MRIVHQVLACALLVAPSAFAAISGTTGAATLIATPANAQLDVITSSTLVYVWNEDQNVLLGAPLAVNAVASGFYNDGSMLVSASIPSGTRVASHYIHFDAPPPDSPAIAAGTVTFDTDILAVIVLGDAGPTTLDDSDFLGSSTLYPDAVALRGIELSINGDNFGISPSRRVLSFNLTMSIPGDFLRVITRPVPAPSTLPILAAGLLTIGARRRGRA